MLMCRIRRRVWFRKLLTCPGSGGCGAVAHVPIHCLPLGFCAVASNDNSPMRTHVNEFANSLFMAHSPQKCLADMNLVRRWILVAVSTLPGIPAQRARHLSEYFLVFATPAVFNQIPKGNWNTDTWSSD